MGISSRWREVIISIDWIILITALLLTGIGLAMFFSATYTQGPISPFFVRQGIVAIIGLIAALLLSQLPYHSFKRYALIFYSLGISLLLVTAIAARAIRGAASRFDILGFQIQPSEFAKIALIICLAAFLSGVKKRISISALLKTALIAGIPIVLVATEPDMGTASVYLGIWWGCLLFWGLPWRYIAVIGCLALIGGGIAWQYVLLDYQKARLSTFLHPSADPLGRGYNVSQSIVALGSGEFLGRGLGHGPQSQLKFLPERHTDFILASIGEELGFIGVTVVITLYSILLWRIVLVAQQTSDPFGRLLVIGVFWTLICGFFVSAGMNMGLLPVTGIPLPLISYGGSNLLETFILLGIVESVRVYSGFKRTAPLEISHIT